MSAYIPPPGLAGYAASKAGLIAFHEIRLEPPIANVQTTDMFLVK